MNNKTIDFKYRPDIDGLRAIAVLSVVFFHAIPDFCKGGFAGVDVFFVISGFLISNLIIQNIDNDTFRISDFYQRRVRRIFPALIFILLVVLVIGWICLLPEELKQLGKHIAASVGFSQNVILWKEAGYFDISSEFKPLLHLWSLGVEEQFYLVWPIFLVFIGKIFRKKRLVYLSGTLLVFIISFYLFLSLLDEDFTKAFYLPQYRFWEMASGGMLALVSMCKPQRYFDNKKNKNFLICINNLIAFTGILILFIVFFKFDREKLFSGINALLPIVAAGLIILSGQSSYINAKLLSHKIFIWFGLISYPLYVMALATFVLR